MSDQITGPLRALLPVAVSYLVMWGLLPASLQGPVTDFVPAIVGFALAVWSWWSNRPKAQVANVAAMPGTIVQQGGAVIKVLEKDLAQAALAAATKRDGT